jgi:biotin carboxyl carrier protein
MKKYNFTIRGNKYDVDIIKIEDNIAEIEVNGSIYEVEIEKTLAPQSKTPTLVRRRAVPTGEGDKKKTHKPTRKAGAGQIKAPLPGTILEMKVKEGDSVKTGDTVLIMEAMKMENNIKADREGTIASVKVANGDSVMEGDVLVEIGD